MPIWVVETLKIRKWLRVATVTRRASVMEIVARTFAMCAEMITRPSAHVKMRTATCMEKVRDVMRRVTIGVSNFIGNFLRGGNL